MRSLTRGSLMGVSFQLFWERSQQKTPYPFDAHGDSPSQRTRASRLPGAFFDPVSTFQRVGWWKRWAPRWDYLHLRLGFHLSRSQISLAGALAPSSNRYRPSRCFLSQAPRFTRPLHAVNGDGRHFNVGRGLLQPLIGRNRLKGCGQKSARADRIGG